MSIEGAVVYSVICSFECSDLYSFVVKSFIVGAFVDSVNCSIDDAYFDAYGCS
jgi:hypothetical protein